MKSNKKDCNKHNPADCCNSHDPCDIKISGIPDESANTCCQNKETSHKEELKCNNCDTTNKTLSELVELNEKMKSDITYLQAEFANYIRRSNETNLKASYEKLSSFLKDFLPVVDSFYSCLELKEISAPTNDRPEQAVNSLFKGVELSINMLSNLLAKYDVQIIDPAPGAIFDANFHEIVSKQASKNFNTNAIIKVVRKGYVLASKVLRAALVIVEE